MTLKLGRKSPVFTPKQMKAALLVSEVLASFGPPPPASAPFVKFVKHPWGMYLNDQIGDCVCAEVAHALLLRTSCAGNPVIATDDDVLKLYEAVGGYVPTDPSTDQGCDEGTMSRYLMSHGFLGHKSVGTGLVVTGVMTPTSINHLKWACQVFVGLNLGVNLPASAMDQFGNGPWDLGGDEEILGGHSVGMVGYDQQFAYLTTWGAVQPATWPWMMKFVEEGHIDLFLDAIRKSGTTPAGFGPRTMARDLWALSID